uniref:Uncharacterized protein n=1 Tax=viral metagenome TaxID=1070528 RepID=A0A6C0I7K0_9ZZZZ
MFVFPATNTMGKYAYTVHPKSGMMWSDIMPLTTNIAILAVIYAFLGSMMSFILYYLFDEYEPDKKNKVWEDKSFVFHMSDLIIEIVLISLASFWVVYFINEHFPIFPVRKHMSHYIDTYSTGLFFMYTIFIFVDSFGRKLRYMYSRYLSPHFDYWLPQEGSIVNCSLHYHQNGSGSGSQKNE